MLSFSHICAQVWRKTIKSTLLFSNKVQMALSRSTSDEWVRVHKHAVGLKWTLAPSPCSPAETGGPAPGKEAKNSHIHMEQPFACLTCLQASSCLCVHICKQLWSTLHISGSMATKEMGLNEHIYTSVCACLLLLSVTIWCKDRNNPSMVLYMLCISTSRAYTPGSQADFWKLS